MNSFLLLLDIPAEPPASTGVGVLILLSLVILLIVGVMLSLFVFLLIRSRRRKTVVISQFAVAEGLAPAAAHATPNNPNQ